MRDPKTEALLIAVREAVTEARRAGVTEMACLWDAAVAAVDKGAHGEPSPGARKLADSIRRLFEPTEMTTDRPGWRCPRCGSPKWVAASLTGPVEFGGRAIKQCVPCGHYGNDPTTEPPARRTEQDGGIPNDAITPDTTGDTP